MGDMEDVFVEYLKQLQKLIIPKQRQINKLFFIFEIALLFFWLCLGWLTITQPKQIFSLLFIGDKLGTIAVILFVTVLLPGIITRLNTMPKVTLPIATLITPFRRHLGITMFLTAFVHMSITSFFPYFALILIQASPAEVTSFSGKLMVYFQNFPPTFQLFEQMAIIGWLLLLPVWVISNDFSMKKLGKWWKRIQRLTYLSIWFIFLHVALLGKNTAALLFVFGMAEILSWVLFWSRRKARVQ